MKSNLRLEALVNKCLVERLKFLQLSVTSNRNLTLSFLSAKTRTPYSLNYKSKRKKKFVINKTTNA